MSIKREIHPTRQRILKKLQELGPMTKYQIAEVCFVAPRNINAYLKLMKQDGEVRVQEWIRSGTGGGAWTKVWGLGSERNAHKPKPMTKAEQARKYREENPEAAIEEVIKKRSKRYHEKMRRLYESTTGVDGRVP